MNRIRDATERIGELGQQRFSFDDRRCRFTSFKAEKWMIGSGSSRVRGQDEERVAERLNVFHIAFEDTRQQRNNHVTGKGQGLTWG